MRHGNFEQQPDTPVNWRIIARLLPYLRDSGGRVGLALLCLLAGKGAILIIPFLLKYLVDSLDGASTATLAPSVLLGLVLAYGAARFSNVLFSELRDTVFGRVTERAMRRIALQVEHPPEGPARLGPEHDVALPP